MAGSLLSLAEWFLDQVSKTDTCWIWTGKRHRYGYGYFQGQQYWAHRLAYQLFVGPLHDPKLCVCHRCDNPLCVNPEHLFLATHQDNMRDKKLKGRCNVPFGSRHYRSKITELQVKEIRELRAQGHSYGAIAKQYGLSNAAVIRICQRKRWAHVA